MRRQNGWPRPARPSNGRGSGRSSRQRSIAYGQRVENTHPRGGFNGDGNSPASGTRRTRAAPAIAGTDASSACV
jgi:hypothetical protein